MAKFWNNLKYHKDTVEKEKLTKDKVEINIINNNKKRDNYNSHTACIILSIWITVKISPKPETAVWDYFFLGCRTIFIKRFHSGIK